MKYNFSAQGAIHSLEQGNLAPYIKIGAFVSMVLVLTMVYLFIQFCGLKHTDAMDQAQIARSIAAGEGFSTKYIRPLALWQLERSRHALPKDHFPDFTQQPLNPILNALPLWLAKDSWVMSPLDIVYTGDRIIALLSTIFFLLAVTVWYFVARVLFDPKLAALSMAAILLTDLMWQFSISGLPQMLMLFLFSCACWFTIKALGEGFPTQKEGYKYLPIAAAFFALMTLTHGLAFWIFLGWFVFMAFLYRRMKMPLLVALGVFLVILSPWLIRNYLVCGNPFGLNIYTALYAGQEIETSLMRSVNPDFMQAARGIREKIKSGTLSQFSNLFGFLGLNILAASFFIAILHHFKSPTASLLRWCVLAMWVFAFAGMSVYGVNAAPISSNQLHVLFIPLFIFFGIAFLMVLWNRLNFENALLSKIFAGVLLLLVSIPMLSTLFLTTPARIPWPPYIPPFIAVLGNWFGEDEILCSDMPWAVAWYANRKTVLLPDSPRTLIRISDFHVLGSSIKGLYLTPLTGNRPMISEIYNGTYREWAKLIARPPDMKGFFLQSFTPLPINGECMIFADSERWMKR